MSRAAPRFLAGSIRLPNVAEGVKVVGDPAFVAGTGAGLEVLDVSAPAASTIVHGGVHGKHAERHAKGTNILKTRRCLCS